MAIPGPGTPIDLQDLADEFGGSTPHQISEYYRGGGEVPDSAANSAVPTSGTISLGNFYGAVNVVTLNLTVSSNTNNYNLYPQVSSNPSYVAGATNINVTVNPGVRVGSTSRTGYAFQIPSQFNSGDNVTLINKGTIVGRAGNGGRGGNAPQGNAVAGQPGGHGLRIQRAVTIQNQGVIAGAGGGGGGSGTARLLNGTSGKFNDPYFGNYSGSGGGGGGGYQVGAGGPRGSNPDTVQRGNNGSPGTQTNGGAGGARRSSNANPGNSYFIGAGGNGGNRGSNGQAGEWSQDTSSPTPGAPNKGSPGGAGSRGRYITGQSFATWQQTGQRLGAAS
jgi:hypothetical protein